MSRSLFLRPFFRQRRRNPLFRPQATLRTFTVGTVWIVGFFTWTTSCAWIYDEYCYQWVSTTGPSMYPTLPNETKYVIVDKRYRLGRGMKIGDLVHTKHPNFRNLRAAKRIVGMPGDLVVRDPAMAPTVGGMEIHAVDDGWAVGGGKEEREEDQQQQSDNDRKEGKRREGIVDQDETRREPTMIEVPPGHVWIVGDNLSWSRDSRFFGPVPMGLILGKIVRHSTLNSDWMVDMVSTSGDQLSPAQMGVEMAPAYNIAGATLTENDGGGSGSDALES